MQRIGCQPVGVVGGGRKGVPLGRDIRTLSHPDLHPLSDHGHHEAASSTSASHQCATLQQAQKQGTLVKQQWILKL